MTLESMWDNATTEHRMNILMDCRWITLDGRPCRIARKAVSRPWRDLSPAMQNVMRNRHERIRELMHLGQEFDAA